MYVWYENGNKLKHITRIKWMNMKCCATLCRLDYYFFPPCFPEIHSFGRDSVSVSASTSVFSSDSASFKLCCCSCSYTND